MTYETAALLLLAALVVVCGVKVFLSRWRGANRVVDEGIAFARSVPSGMVWVSPEELDIP